MKIATSEVKAHVQKGAVVQAAGVTYRKGDRLPKEWPESVHHATVIRDEKGRLTRAGMEQVLKEGGSVLHEGVILSNLDDLPDEADLVQGDEFRRQQLAEQLDVQIAELMRQRQKVTDPGASAPRPTPLGGGDVQTATQPVMYGGRIRSVPAEPDVRLADLFPEVVDSSQLSVASKTEEAEQPAQPEQPREQGAAPVVPSREGESGRAAPPPPPANPPGQAELLVPPAYKPPRPLPAPRRGRPPRSSIGGSTGGSEPSPPLAADQPKEGEGKPPEEAPKE